MTEKISRYFIQKQIFKNKLKELLTKSALNTLIKTQF
jgi:hypothetical protein